METSLIEQLDKSRYNLLKWLTIGWAMWFGWYILKNLTDNQVIIVITSFISLLGWAIFIINLIQFIKLKRELKWNTGVKEALENELHLLNLRKSYQIGFWVVIGITVFFFGFTTFWTISVRLVTEITIYFGVLSVLIAGLIYNRE